MKTKIILLLCYMCAIFFRLDAQSFKVFDTSNSELSSNSVECVAIDQAGNKWIGTDKSGLFKYDGKTFTKYDKTNSPISGEYVSRIFIDAKNNVWVQTGRPRGLAKFGGAKWTVFNANDCPLADGFVCVTEDKKGMLYFGTDNGLFTYDGKAWAKLKMPKEDIFRYNIRAIAINSSGEPAIGCDAGLMIFDGKEWHSYTEENSGLQLSVVRALGYLPSGALCIGYGGGFGNGGFSTLKDGIWKHFNKTNSAIPDHMVRKIVTDVKGNTWMGTNDGLVKVNSAGIQPIKFFPGLFQNVVMDIAIDGDKVWVATTKGLIELD